MQLSGNSAQKEGSSSEEKHPAQALPAATKGSRENTELWSHVPTEVTGMTVPM